MILARRDGTGVQNVTVVRLDTGLALFVSLNGDDFNTVSLRTLCKTEFSVFYKLICIGLVLLVVIR